MPLIPQYHLLQQPTTAPTEETSQENEESAEGVAAVVEQCDAMETTEELPPSPTHQEPTLAQEEELEELGAGGEAMLEGDEGASANHTAVATTVTVVSSPSPSSTSSSSTELASAQSLSSDSTFMSVEEVLIALMIIGLDIIFDFKGPKETFADTKLCEARSNEEEPNKAQRNPLNINIDFSQVSISFMFSEMIDGFSSVLEIF